MTYCVNGTVTPSIKSLLISTSLMKTLLLNSIALLLVVCVCANSSAEAASVLDISRSYSVAASSRVKYMTQRARVGFFEQASTNHNAPKALSQEEFSAIMEILAEVQPNPAYRQYKQFEVDETSAEPILITCYNAKHVKYAGAGWRLNISEIGDAADTQSKSKLLLDSKLYRKLHWLLEGGSIRISEEG